MVFDDSTVSLCHHANCSDWLHSHLVWHRRNAHVEDICYVHWTPNSVLCHVPACDRNGRRISCNAISSSGGRRSWDTQIQVKNPQVLNHPQVLSLLNQIGWQMKAQTWILSWGMVKSSWILWMAWGPPLVYTLSLTGSSTSSLELSRHSWASP